MKISVLGGDGEIGGNKILVEGGKGRILLDFGQSFTHLDEFFIPESNLYPRDRFGLKDYFEFDLMPKLKGLYSRNALEHTDLPHSAPEYDAVFVSHAHFDHIGHLRFLDPSIPIFMGEATRKIIRSTEKTSSSQSLPFNADVRTFRSGKEIEIGGFKVTPIHVDHSVPGAYGLIIEGDGGTLAYTGDIRQHGPRADMTEEFLAKAAGVDTLIIEGTRVAPEERRRDYLSEKAVHSKTAELIENSKDAIITSRYPKDLDRFRTFYDIARASGRELVISIKTAHLLLALKDEQELAMPDPLADKGIKVYGRVKKIYYEWEKELITHCVNSRYVSRKKNEVIFEMDFYTLPELIDLRPEKGDFIHSMSEPFQEDPLSIVSDDILDNWLKHFHLKRHQLHASGHASMAEIFGMVDRIGAKKVIPVHTEHPEMFKR